LVSSAIIKSSIKRDEKACRQLYEQSIAYVFSIVQLYIRNVEIRKDVVQEVYANTFRKLHQFDEYKGSFKLWIRKITVNQCLMYLRKEEKSTPIVSLGFKEETIIATEVDMHQLSRRDIEKMLSKMPSGYRTIFLLVTMDGYSHEEVSELLNISKETSRSQLSRARTWMRKYFFSMEKIRKDGIF